MRRLVLLMTLSTALPLGAQTPIRYRFESTTRATTDMSGSAMDLTAMMPNLADQEIKIMALFSVVSKDSASGKVYHVVVDSMENSMGEMMAGLMSAMGGMGADSSIAKEMAGMTASVKGASIHLFARNGKQVYQTPSITGNMNLTALSEAVSSLIPSPKMLTAKWNESWIDSSGIVIPGMGEAMPFKTRQSGFTKWRVTAKDTIEAVVATSMDMDSDSAGMAAIVAATRDSTRPAREAPNLSMKMKNTVNGTRRVILGPNKEVVEVSSSLETMMNMNMPMIGDMKSKGVARTSLVKLPG